MFHTSYFSLLIMNLNIYLGGNIFHTVVLPEHWILSKKEEYSETCENSHPQIDKTKILMTTGSVKLRSKVLQNAPLDLH